MSTPKGGTGPGDAAKRTPGQVLSASRKRDSQVKRTRVLSALDEMARTGERITFLAVARKAEVSTWLVYSDAMREHVEKAIKKQGGAERKGKAAGSRASAESLAVDLELAKEQIKELRAERDRLKGAVQRGLGARLEQAGTKDLVARVHELTAAHERAGQERDLALSQLSAVTAERDRLRSELVEKQEEVENVREAGRQLMKEVNLSLRSGGPPGPDQAAR